MPVVVQTLLSEKSPPMCFTPTEKKMLNNIFQHALLMDSEYVWRGRKWEKQRTILGLVVSGLHGQTDHIFIKTKFAVPWYMQKSKRISIVPSIQRKKIEENIHATNEPRVQPNPQTWDDLWFTAGNRGVSQFNYWSGWRGFNWKQLPSPHPAPRMTHHLPLRPSVLQNILHHHGNSQTSALTRVWLDWILLPFFFFFFLVSVWLVIDLK